MLVISNKGSDREWIKPYQLNYHTCCVQPLQRIFGPSFCDDDDRIFTRLVQKRNWSLSDAWGPRMRAPRIAVKRECIAHLSKGKTTQFLKSRRPERNSRWFRRQVMRRPQAIKGDWIPNHSQHVDFWVPFFDKPSTHLFEVRNERFSVLLFIYSFL